MPDEGRSDRGEGWPDLDQAVRELAIEGGSEDHPDPVTLLDYHEGKLSKAVAERVQEHVARCRACAETILDYDRFPNLDPPTEEQRMTPDGVERERKRLDARIAAELVPGWRRSEVAWSVAALFFLAVVGLGLWSAELRGRIASLEAPRGDVHNLGSLVPEGMGRRGGEALVVPSWASRIQFFLVAPPDDGRFDGYSVDILTEDGGAVHSDLRLRRSPMDPLLVDLPRRSLADGVYQVELFGLEHGVRSPVASYRMRIGSERGS